MEKPESTCRDKILILRAFVTYPLTSVLLWYSIYTRIYLSIYIYICVCVCVDILAWVLRVQLPTMELELSYLLFFPRGGSSQQTRHPTPFPSPFLLVRVSQP